MINYTLFGNNQAGLINQISSLDPTVRYVCKIVEFTETRTSLQNRTIHGWYNELAGALKEYDAVGYRCFCKLNFGVLIMRTEDAEFKTVYDNVIRPLSYEKKIEAMKILPVTSLMSTKQLSAYIDAIKDYYWQNHGYDLKLIQG